jgi:hypothetical protein
MSTQHTASTTFAGTVTTGRGVARKAWRKIGATISEMNYAACRVATPRTVSQSGRRAA